MRRAFLILPIAAGMLVLWGRGRRGGPEAEDAARTASGTGTAPSVAGGSPAAVLRRTESVASSSSPTPPPEPRSPFHEGRVVSPSGRPVSGAEAWWETAGGGRVSSTSDANGRFLIGDVPAYPIPVHAARNAYLPETSVPLTESGFGAPLVIEPGTDVPLRVSGARWFAIGDVSLMPTAVRERPAGAPIQVRRVGNFDFVAEGVVLGEPYDVWVPPTSDGELLLARGVRFPREGIELFVAKAEAKAAGRVVRPKGVDVVHLVVELRPGLASVAATSDETGAFRIGPLPAGEWPGRASASDAEETWTWSGTLSTAKENLVVLRRGP